MALDAMGCFGAANVDVEHEIYSEDADLNIRNRAERIRGPATAKEPDRAAPHEAFHGPRIIGSGDL